MIFLWGGIVAASRRDLKTAQGAVGDEMEAIRKENDALRKVRDQFEPLLIRDRNKKPLEP
jgi:hypothetical protein